MRSHHLSVVRLSGLTVGPFGGGPPYQHHAQRGTGESTLDILHLQTKAVLKTRIVS